LCIIDCEGNGRGFTFHSGEGADSIVAGLTITNGYTAGVGGGVSCFSSHPTLTHCVISGNSASWGGGVDCDLSSPTLIRCTIMGNSANYGGAVSCYDASNATLTNCVIRGNVADLGGGVCCYNSSNPTLVNCTICGNSAAEGGGASCHGSSSPTLANCILWGDSPDEIYVASGSATATYCDIQGGWSGTGNFDADPLLDVDGVHLQEGSPCVNSGNNDVSPLPAEDCDGDARVQHCRVDVGADETSFYLDCNLNGRADACDLMGLPLSDDSPPLPFTTPTGVVTYVIPSAPAALSDVVFQIMADNSSPGTVLLSVNGTLAVTGSLAGAPGCGTQYATLTIDAETFNALLTGGGTVLTIEIMGGTPCGVGVLVVVTQYATVPALDCDENDVPDECERLIGDLNCDGELSIQDINPFVLALSNPAAYVAAYPECDLLNADINGDCIVHIDDINPFVVLLSTR
jgi:hypothetical protein